MFEHKRDALVTRRHFALRLLKAFLLTVALVAFSVGLGTVGFHWLTDHGWAESLYQMARILSGQPHTVDPMTTGGRVFVVFYGFYGRLLFVTMIAVVLAPILHRLLHLLHLECDGSETLSGEPER